MVLEPKPPLQPVEDPSLETTEWRTHAGAQEKVRRKERHKESWGLTISAHPEIRSGGRRVVGEGVKFSLRKG